MSKELVNIALMVGTRSSMDRIKDSGSFDKGSIPFGCTS